MINSIRRWVLKRKTRKNRWQLKPSLSFLFQLVLLPKKTQQNLIFFISNPTFYFHHFSFTKILLPRSQKELNNIFSDEQRWQHVPLFDAFINFTMLVWQWDFKQAEIRMITDYEFLKLLNKLDLEQLLILSLSALHSMTALWTWVVKLLREAV